MNTEKTAEAKASRKDTSKVILTTPGFGPITAGNIGAYVSKQKKFLADKQHAWFLHDTMGLTEGFKKGQKFDRFVSAMQDAQNDNDFSPEVKAACKEAEALALEIADMPIDQIKKEVKFNPGSGAESQIGRAIDKRAEKEASLKAAAEKKEEKTVNV